MKRTTITLIDTDHDADQSASEQTIKHLLETHLTDGPFKEKLSAAIDEYGRTQFGRGYVKGGEDERRGRY